MPASNEQSDTNQRLVDRYTEIAALAGGLAHEIRNPLSTIQLNMELLAEDFAEPQSATERRAQAKIALVQRECQRLNDLLDDFLNFIKARAHRLEPCNLNNLVRRVTDFFRPKAEESGIEMRDYLDPNLPSVLLDQESFYGGLLNLVLNAEQAMPDGGTLVLRTRVTAYGIALDIIDTGHGIDAETISKVFDAFYSTKHGGSGLGLPAAKRIVEAHQGRITVQSEIGRGTCFTIELPVPARLPSSGDAPPAHTILL